ncbi:hypothetical protein OAC86_00845 [bacterium]|nr:hypothetical protein [bacterium]
MSNNEKNITPVERKILENLNIRAALILQAEETFKNAKISMNPEILHNLDEEALLGLLETWSPENQERLKDKHVKKNN